MTNDSSNERQAPPGGAKATPPAASDERDAAIERLEVALLEERRKSAALRGTVEGLNFKLGVLEKSYSKQLADARQRTDAAERTVAEQSARLAALDGDPAATLQALEETRAELERVTAERDQLRRQLAASGAPRSAVAQEDGEQIAEGTINRLIADPSWRREGSGAPQSHLEAQVAVAESPAEELLAPELVFTKGREEGDDDSAH